MAPVWKSNSPGAFRRCRGMGVLVEGGGVSLISFIFKFIGLALETSSLVLEVSWLGLDVMAIEQLGGVGTAMWTGASSKVGCVTVFG